MVIEETRQLMRKATVSFCIFNLFPLFLVASDLMGDSSFALLFFGLFGLVQVVAFWVFHNSIGQLARGMGRSWITWVGLSWLTTPVGPFVAFIRMRRIVAEISSESPSKIDRHDIARDTEQIQSRNTTKQCPFCAEDILSAAIKCKHCGEMLDGHESGAVGGVASSSVGSSPTNKPAIQRQPSNKLKNTVAVVLTFLIVGTMIKIMTQRAMSAQDDQRRTVTQASVSNNVAQSTPVVAKARKPKPRNEHPIYGEDGVLRVNGGGEVPVAASKAAYDRLAQLAGSNDTMGIQQLLLNGNVWMADGGTRVTVIATDWTRFEVRIKSGESAGRSGFVKRDFVWSR